MESVCKYLRLQVNSQVQLQLAKILQFELVHFSSCEIVLQLISSLSCSDSFPLPISQVEFHNLRNWWMVDFFCVFPPCILVWFLAMGYEAPKLSFFMNLSFNLLCHELYKDLPHSWIALVIKKLSKTPKLNTIWLETIARVLNMPIELKGNNYYSKVFKRVNYKL